MMKSDNSIWFMLTHLKSFENYLVIHLHWNELEALFILRLDNFFAGFEHYFCINTVAKSWIVFYLILLCSTTFFFPMLGAPINSIIVWQLLTGTATCYLRMSYFGIQLIKNCHKLMRGIRNTAEVISEIQKVEFIGSNSYKASQKSDIR